MDKFHEILVEIEAGTELYKRDGPALVEPWTWEIRAAAVLPRRTQPR